MFRRDTSSQEALSTCLPVLHFLTPLINRTDVSMLLVHCKDEVIKFLNCLQSIHDSVKGHRKESLGDLVSFHDLRFSSNLRLFQYVA